MLQIKRREASTPAIAGHNRSRQQLRLAWWPAALAGAIAVVAGFVFMVSGADWARQANLAVAEAPLRLQGNLQLPSWLLGSAVMDAASQTVIDEQQARIRSLQARLMSSEREVGMLRPQIDDLNRQLKGQQDVVQRTTALLALASADAAARRQALAVSASVESAAAPPPAPVANAVAPRVVAETSSVRATVFSIAAAPAPKTGVLETAAKVAEPAKATLPPTCDRQARMGGDAPLTIQFDRAKDMLEIGHHKTLNEVLAVAVGCPGTTIEIKGYSDNRGTQRLKSTVSERRAELTAKFLEAHGVKPEQMSVVAMADRAPLDTNDTDAGRARNRRVEIRLRQSN